MSLLKQFLRKTPLYVPARRLFRRLKNTPRHPIQDTPNSNLSNFVHLGSEYGGWTFVDHGDMQGCTIISAGLGEDASFDVEFAARYDAKVIIVDPTPRAIEHFRGISERLGRRSECGYSKGGMQAVDAYDLSSLNSDSLILINKALWNQSTRLKFFEPANSRHVSHSVITYPNEHSDMLPHIEVGSITLVELVRDLRLQPQEIPLMKLDIEGAEIEVLEQAMLNTEFRPRQILVEFDELNNPSEWGFERVSKVHDLLTANNYRIVNTNGQADFLYLRGEVQDR